MASRKLKTATKKNGVKDKWAKTVNLLKDEGIRTYVPTTRRLSKLALFRMLKEHGMVYVKPTYGSMGRGVMRVERAHVSGEAIGYTYQTGKTKRQFSSFESFYSSLRKAVSGKSYLMQKGIHLLKYEGRPFDLRVVVQQAPEGGWETTGIVARIAHPDKIVTNGSQGGTILPAERVLQPYMNGGQIDSLFQRLDHIAIQTMKRLHRKFPHLKEIGLDIAVDRNMRAWILEVNTTPDHCPFAILQDQTMIRRIVYYGSQYGRSYKLKCLKAQPGV